MYLPHSVAGKITSDTECLQPRTAPTYREAIIRKGEKGLRRNRGSMPSPQERMFGNEV